jgi:hypothetical protein
MVMAMLWWMRLASKSSPRFIHRAWPKGASLDELGRRCLETCIVVLCRAWANSILPHVSSASAFVVSRCPTLCVSFIFRTVSHHQIFALHIGYTSRVGDRTLILY